jgi:hypothetical protein
MGAFDTPLHAHHAVGLRGLAVAQAAAPALLVDVEAEDFVAALVGALKAARWPRFGWPEGLPLAALSARAAPRALFQPIHRRFNLLVLDTHCASFGTPRLDPRRIDSAGFVVRRWAGPDAGAAMPDADALADPRHWLLAQGEGWRRAADLRDLDADPDPAHRPLVRTGNALVDAELRARARPAPAEATHKLYPLPPEVAEHSGRTLLYGLLPTGDAQPRRAAQAVDYAAVRAPGGARDEFVAHLSPYLRRTSGVRLLPERQGRFDASWLDAEAEPLVDADEPDSTQVLRQRAQFTAFIRQLALEFDIAGERGAPLRSLLDELPLAHRRHGAPGLAGFGGLGLSWREPVSAAAFLVACARVVTERDAPAVPIPDEFGPVPAGWTERFVDAALTLLDARSAEARTLEGRYDEAGALYAVRAFVRVKGDAPGCPPRLVWSAMTPLYSIAPWYASTGVPQARIALPPIDAASLRSMKPNVAFELPPSLHKLLALNSPKALLGGTARPGSDIGIGWLCSFSIPIITICAFIALNVILVLLDFVFRWMPFVKICLPVPKRK